MSDALTASELRETFEKFGLKAPTQQELDEDARKRGFADYESMIEEVAMRLGPRKSLFGMRLWLEAGGTREALLRITRPVYPFPPPLIPRDVPRTET